jgi:uncharacterized Ntn-hydrolase superfamily protein
MPTNRRFRCVTAGLVQIVACLALVPPIARAQTGDPGTPDPAEMGTYSLIVRDPATGEMGLGVQSKAFSPGNRVATARGGFAIIAHQAVSNPMFGAVGMTLLESGMTPQEAMDFMVKGDNGANRRQIAILDVQGRSAAWTGPGTSDWKGHKCTELYCVEGNTLAGPQVLEAMEKSISTSTGPLALRLLDALDAAQAAGGDARGMQGAAIFVVKPNAGPSGYSDRAVDVRVDDHPEPLKELRRLVNMDRSNKLIAQVNAALSNERLDQAFELAQQARDASPGNDIAWVALANVLQRRGQKAEAVAALRKAAELNPANKVTLPRNPLFEQLHREMRIVY